MVKGAALAVASVALAQVMTPTGNPSLDLMTQLVSALGPMGFVMWLVYRTTHYTIPRLAKNFEEAIDRQRVDFKEIVAQQRQDFLGEMGREREVHTEQMGRLASAVERLADRGNSSR